MYADDEIIQARNDERADKDLLETQVGFYSKDFLRAYQAAWFDVIQLLGEQANMKVVEYDSGKLSPNEIIEDFVRV